MVTVGLWERKITTIHPIPTIMFKNMLRTFEVEIIKIVQNIQSQLKIMSQEHSVSAQKFDRSYIKHS